MHVACCFLDCGPPMSIYNGSVEYHSSVYQSVAYYMCDAGFELSGETTVYCQDSGLWSDADNHCKIRGNIRVSNIIHTHLLYTSSTIETKVEYLVKQHRTY